MGKDFIKPTFLIAKKPTFLFSEKHTLLFSEILHSYFLKKQHCYFPFTTSKHNTKEPSQKSLNFRDEKNE